MKKMKPSSRSKNVIQRQKRDRNVKSTETSKSMESNHYYDDYIPTPMIANQTLLSFSFWAFVFLYANYQYYGPELVDVCCTKMLKLFIFYPLVYCYCLDFVSGISHGIFDNSSNLGGLKDLPMNNKFEIHRYCQYYKLANVTSWNKFAWLHQRHHSVMHIQHSCTMTAGFHYMLLIPTIFYAIILFCNQNNCNDICWYCTNWAFGLIYGLPSMYFIHGLCHARTHEPNLVPKIAKILQDWYIILNPKIHSRHHKNEKRYYSIVNGWSHTFQNLLLDLIDH